MAFFKKSPPAPQPNPGAQPQPQPLFLLTLTPGVELFTPDPSPAHQHFKVSIRGFYHYNWRISVPGRSNCGWQGQADACYDAIETRNFITPYPGMHFDGEPIQPFQEDRHTHTYVFAYVGTGKKLAILLTPSLTHFEKLRVDSSPLKVRIDPLGMEDAERS